MFASLRSRIVLILIAAVVPAAILVCIFAYRTFDDARAMQIASLDRDARFLLSRLDVVPATGLRMAQTLAIIRDFSTSRQDCEQRGRDILDRYEQFASFAVVAADGGISCEYAKEGGVTATQVLSDGTGHAKIPDTPATALRSLADGRKVLVGIAPSRNETILVVIDDSYVSRLISEFHSTPSSVAAIVDGNGKPAMISKGATGPDYWPADPPVLAKAPTSRSAASMSGVAIVYTTGKLTSVDLWLLTLQKENDVLGLPRRQLLVTALAPLVMILAAVIAIWIGLHGSVLRWVNALSKATRAYSAGAMTSRVGEAAMAPREFAELAASFDALADRMAERTLDLEREIASKTNYIREIHHRVKNNLQVIGSLLALQKRELAADQRAVLRFPEDRVNAMSAAYRASYAVSEIGQVPIANVVREVSHRLQASGDARNVRFDLDFRGGELEVDLDTAISIAMLLAEILPAYADSGDRDATPVSIALSATPQTLSLAIKGSLTTERQSFHLARRFINAYLRQLNATIDETKPGETLIEAPFPGNTARRT